MSSITRDINSLLDDLLSNESEQKRATIIDELNKITREGANVRDLFTNHYYINDHGEDLRCATAAKEDKINNEL